MTNFTTNLRQAFASDIEQEFERDRADIVQTVLIIAGFAMAAMSIVSWISAAAMARATDVSDCIAVSTVENPGACTNPTNGKAAKDNNSYGKRFG